MLRPWLAALRGLPDNPLAGSIVLARRRAWQRLSPRARLFQLSLLLLPAMAGAGYWAYTHWRSASEVLQGNYGLGWTPSHPLIVGVCQGLACLAALWLAYGIFLYVSSLLGSLSPQRGQSFALSEEFGLSQLSHEDVVLGLLRAALPLIIVPLLALQLALTLEPLLLGWTEPYATLAGEIHTRQLIATSEMKTQPQPGPAGWEPAPQVLAMAWPSWLFFDLARSRSPGAMSFACTWTLLPGWLQAAAELCVRLLLLVPLGLLGALLLGLICIALAGGSAMARAAPFAGALLAACQFFYTEYHSARVLYRTTTPDGLLLDCTLQIAVPLLLGLPLLIMVLQRSQIARLLAVLTTPLLIPALRWCNEGIYPLRRLLANPRVSSSINASLSALQLRLYAGEGVLDCFTPIQRNVWPLLKSQDWIFLSVAVVKFHYWEPLLWLSFQLALLLPLLMLARRAVSRVRQG